MRTWERKKRKLMDGDCFEKWIGNMGGITSVSKLLGVSVSCVSRWSNRNRLPNPAMAYKIVRLSKGQVTLDDIFRRQPNSTK